MKGWIKYFTDGTHERGIDSAVRHSQASWSRGRHRGILSVESHHDRYLMKIVGPGVYHQSDDCEVKLYHSHSRVVLRRLQKQLAPQDRFIVLTAGTRALTAQVCSNVPNLDPPPPGAKREIIPLGEEYVNQWLTLELDLTQGEMRLRFAEGKI